MRVVHYTQFNASGMNRVAESIVSAERAAGLDSHLLNIFDEQDWSVGFDADVHVAHTHFPDFKNGQSFRRMLTKTPKIVAFFHGTPEFVFGDTVKSIQTQGHWAGDGLQMLYYWLKMADARITHWPRHQAMYQALVDRGTEIDCIPMGVDHAFWSGGSSKGKWGGNPSVLSCENAHFIKWPFDLITAWRWIYPQLENGSLNLGYVPEDLHRVWAPWITNTGAGYGMRWSATMWHAENLRDIFKSIDFFVGLVRYGDFNRLSHEANVAGARTISYRGNPHADYWVTEGDQRILAAELLAILRGDVAPRAKTPVPHIEETVAALAPIYERVLARDVFNGFELPFAPCVSYAPAPTVLDLREQKATREQKPRVRTKAQTVKKPAAAKKTAKKSARRKGSHPRFLL